MDDAEGSGGASKLKALFESEQQKLQFGNASFLYQPPKVQSQEFFVPSTFRQVLFSAELLDVVSTLSSGRQDNATIEIFRSGALEKKRSSIVVYDATKAVVVDVPFMKGPKLMPGTNCRIVIETVEQIMEGMFRSTDTCLEFARVFVYALYHEHPVPQVLQDVVCPKDGREIEDGDVVQVLCKVLLGKPWEESHAGTVFREEGTSEKTIRVDIGSGTFRELEEGIKQMRKGGRRLLMFKAVDNEDFPVLYDVTVARMRRRKMSRDERVVKEEEKHPEPSPSDYMQSSEMENVETVKDRLARMTRAGAAVNLHLFTSPTLNSADKDLQLEFDKLILPCRDQRTADTFQEQGPAEVSVYSNREVSPEHLQLLQDIKQSQNSMSETLAVLSTKFEALANTKQQSLDRRLVLETETVDDESNSEEDNLVDAIARMIAENRALRRRLSYPTSKEPRTSKLIKELGKDQLDEITHKIYLDMELEMSEKLLDKDLKAVLLDSLQRKLAAASTSILETVNQS